MPQIPLPFPTMLASFPLLHIVILDTSTILIMVSDAALRIRTTLDIASAMAHLLMTSAIQEVVASRVKSIRIIAFALEQTWMTLTILAIAALETQSILDNASAMPQIILMTKIKVRLPRMYRY